MAEINIQNIGNVITPKGGSLILAKSVDANNLEILEESTESYSSYTIIATEEEQDEPIYASEIVFQPTDNIDANNVQDAFVGVEQLIDNNTPQFIREAVIIDEDGESTFILENTFSSVRMLVFYNGLLLEPSLHYIYTNNTITLIDFTSEAGDVLSVVGITSQGGGY